MKIVIPGGSGQVGHILSRYFTAAAHNVCILGRKNPAEQWVATLEDSDVCINLAGRSVNCRYYRRNRRVIYNSRIQTTLLLHRMMASLRRPPPLWINASTATIYRHALDRPMNERDGELGGNEPGAPDTWNFSIDVAKGWEQAFFSATLPSTRQIAIRSAMTFSPDPGGVFDVLLGLVRFGLGGRQGPGTQFVSWIHETDFARAIEFLIAHQQLSGVVNLASPNPLPNRDFMRDLRNAWGARVGLAVPNWMLEIGTFLLQTESELILKSRRVIPTRLSEAGFSFQYPEWPSAARDLVSRWRQMRS